MFGRKLGRIIGASVRVGMLGLALLSLGCGAASSASSETAGRGSAKAKQAPAAREVRVALAERASLPRTVAVSGTLAADEQVSLAMKVTGRLDLMAVDLGSPARQGQVLARLAPADFELRVAQAQNALEQARARLGLTLGGPDGPVDPAATAGVREADAVLRQARVTHDRMASLQKQQLISQSDFDSADANLQVAEARRQDALEEARNRLALLAQRRSELGIARQQLADSRLTAPFDGVVRERRAAAGDYVAVGQPLLVLVKVHPLRLRLAVPERDAAGVRVGQAVRLTLEGDPTAYSGRVARISPAISEDSRTLAIEAEVPNQDGRLRPGSFARAEIVTRTAEPALLVPASAVVTFAGVDKVISVQGGRAREEPVKTGRRAGGRVEILAGVAAGQPVVLDPGNLVSGEPVTVVP